MSDHGLQFEIGQLRMLLDWTKDPACGLFMRLLDERIGSHSDFIRSPKTDARRVDFERGGLDSAEAIKKLLGNGIESAYRIAVDQEPAQDGRSRDTGAGEGERGGDVERGPE